MQFPSKFVPPHLTFLKTRDMSPNLLACLVQACAIFQLSVDIALVAQTYLYREQTALDLQNRIGLNEGGVAGLSGAVDAARLHRHEAREHQLEEEEDANEDEEERVGSVGGGGNVSVGAAGARRYDR